LDSVPEAAAHDLSPADIPLEILLEDDVLLVVNKPRGLATHPAASLKEPSLVNALLGRSTTLSAGSADFRPGIVHRLDKDTSGLLVIAKTDAVHVKLARQIAGKTADRRYFAAVAGTPDQERFTINAPIGRDQRNRQKMAVDQHGKSAITHVKRIARLEAGFLVAVKLETGRTHQIRVHLRAIGHPVLGDRIYAPAEYAKGPLQLHAAFLAFDHPISGERVALFQPVPAEFLGAEFASRESIERF
jgi:23S rRNA pseudouridine1911/1915/1917 synthase